MVEIIAEIGISHEGKLPTALKLVDEAKRVGAGVCKFQTFTAETTLRSTDPDFKTIKDLELSRSSFRLIAKHCEDVGIEFMSTPDHLDDLKFLVEEMGVKRIKIGSADLTNKPLVDAAYRTGKPVIMSTGMATLDEVYKALPHDGGFVPITLLHCVSLYPTQLEETNLLAIRQLIKLGYPVGFSDHTIGSIAAVMAVTLGATVIEKHMCPNGYGGIDANASMMPFEFGQFIRLLRDCETALGTGKKEPTQGELKFISRLRKGTDGLRGLNKDLFPMY